MKNLLIPEQPFFTESQFGRLSNILDGAGQVGLGTIVLGQLFNGESLNIFVAFLGLLAVLSLWLLSLVVARRREVYQYG